jgi:hypothetical protein
VYEDVSEEFELTQIPGFFPLLGFGLMAKALEFFGSYT